MVYYLSADECSKLHLIKIYSGAGSSLKWINAVIGTLAAKRSIMDWCVNRLHAQALIINWRRQSFNAENPGWDTGDQLESPLNSGQLNPAYITHLDQWVSLAEEYGIYIVFQEWFSPMRAAERGEWAGYNDTVFHQNWANFYNVLAAHFAGRPAVAGFISCEEVIANVPVGTTTIEEWPYTVTCSAPFNSLWNSIMTKLSLAVHQGDSNFNFIASPTVDWGGGASSLGSKADYPNAWQHLADPNPHILYRVMWNPWNQIKTDINYPYDDSLNRGVVNYHRETGTPIILECLVSWVPSWPGGVWVWDAVGLQWLRDILKVLSKEGIGLNMGAYGKSSAIPYCIFDDLGNEQPWVQVYSEREPAPTSTPPIPLWKVAAVWFSVFTGAIAALKITEKR